MNNKHIFNGILIALCDVRVSKKNSTDEEKGECLNFRHDAFKAS